MVVSVSAGKSFEDDDVELICSKSGLEPLQALTDALAATHSAQEQQSLLQVGPGFTYCCTATGNPCAMQTVFPWCQTGLPKTEVEGDILLCGTHV